MRSQFRATTPDDAPAVSAILRRIFHLDPDAPLTATQHLYWKCWEESSQWSGSRGYVTEKDGVITAHGTVVPLVCLSGTRRISMVHLIDWAADPRAVGSGVFLLKSIAQLVDAMIVAGGSEITQKVLPALGFKECGEVTNYVLPLRPIKQLATRRLSVRSIARAGRDVLWSLRAPSSRVRNWTSTRIVPEDLASAAIPWPHPTNETAIFERTPDAMAYYLKCPAAPMALYSVAKNGLVCGYFLLAGTPGQQRIVDFYANSDDREVWRILIELAVLQAKCNPDAAEVVSAGSDSVTRQALTDCGFHAKGSSPLRLLVKKGVEIPTGPIRFQMIDSDAGYLY